MDKIRILGFSQHFLPLPLILVRSKKDGRPTNVTLLGDYFNIQRCLSLERKIPLKIQSETNKAIIFEYIVER